MKKFLITLFCLFIAATVNAETIFVESNVNVDNYWQKSTWLEVKLVDKVGRRLIHANNLKRAPIFVERNRKIVNAYASTYNKRVVIYMGTLAYINNDDELAFILGHELAHAQEYYDGFCKLIAMKFNNKKYEYKADLKAIDYMVKAGYNPIAAIIISNKIFDEPLWDWGFLSLHPTGSKRLIKMYEYIYKKYPSYLTSSMTNSPAYLDFLKNYEKELSSFRQRQARKNNNL